MITSINLFRIYENYIQSEKELNEGLIKTYPIDKSFDILLNKIDPYVDDVPRASSIKGNRILLTCNRLSISEFINLLTTINNLGYFISTIKPYIGTMFKSYSFIDFKTRFFDENNLNKFTSYDIIIEAKYDIIHNTTNTKLYHATEDIYVEKILKNGLVLKSYNTMIDYPERIYVTDNILESKKFIDSKISYFKFNQDKDVDKKINKDTYRKKSDTPYVILEIDNSNLDLTLYIDPNMKNAYFILDTISPQRIKISNENK